MHRAWSTHSGTVRGVMWCLREPMRGGLPGRIRGWFDREGGARNGIGAKPKTETILPVLWKPRTSTQPRGFPPGFWVGICGRAVDGFLLQPSSSPSPPRALDTKSPRRGRLWRDSNSFRRRWPSLASPTTPTRVGDWGVNDKRKYYDVIKKIILIKK